MTDGQKDPQSNATNPPAGATPAERPAPQQTPTVGRIVHARIGGSRPKSEYPAIVTHHHGGGLVNLHVFEDDGLPHNLRCYQSSVPPLQDGEELAENQVAWRWPPRA